MKKTLWLVDSPSKITQDDIFFGAWCFNENFQKKADEDLEFISLDEMRLLENNSNEIISDLINFFESNLLSIENQPIPRKYLDIMIKPWLNAFVHLVVLRFHRFKKIIKLYNDDYFDVILLKDNISWKFNDTLDFVINGSLNKIFNFWLISRIIENNKPARWNLSYISENYDNKKTIRNISLKDKLYNHLISLIPIYSVKGLSLLNSVLLQFKLGLKKANFISEDRINRKKKSKLNSDFNWELYAMKLLPENFKNLKLNLKNKKIHRYIICCGSKMYYDEGFKQKIAERVCSGDKLILSQHGGVYGSVAVHAAVNSVEFSNSQKYITWGWKGNSYLNETVPLPSPYLSKFNYINQNGNIIFIDSNVNLYSFRINSINLSFENLNRRNNLFKIYSSLDDKLKKHFYYRPPLSQSGGEVLSLDFKKQFKEKVNIIEGDLHTETMKSKVVLIDGPNTTMNILLSAKVPTIAFWNNNYNFFDENILEIIEKLKKHGVIHDSPNKAIRKLNEVYFDIDSWWLNKELQKTLDEFNKNYALADYNYMNSWSKFIEKLN